jgi:acyl-CoA thioester hydrolase
MKFLIPDIKKFIYEQRMPIRWGDMDAMNHVNNTSYFRYLETCRIDWMAAVGVKVVASGPGGVPHASGAAPERNTGTEGLVIVNAFCNFYLQLQYPGDIIVKMFASDPTRTAFETWATIERVDQPGVIYSAGGATTIWIDFATGKATTMPDWLRALVS